MVNFLYRHRLFLYINILIGSMCLAIFYWGIYKSEKEIINSKKAHYKDQLESAVSQKEQSLARLIDSSKEKVQLIASRTKMKELLHKIKEGKGEQKDINKMMTDGNCKGKTGWTSSEHILPA